ncbi:MAG: metalloregulator ArsR/SmtB family transcription factor [Rhodospirillales bacterium]|jgi:ArsR family transcriptional regulator|nr:metalloregulator ArsR/SmtB family transcription factor [Rhodospirillales bacterium]MDP6643059.1 metalloregulator ArsR/SmtB family transcription factor [Rhodospirillales bacterium]MDP6841023.1 metalloregulator ArsR/SmtB family transcription factor [Rhodospirillales bacterium]
MRRLRAAAEPSRLRLLAMCARGEFTVSELVLILSQSQPRVSRHLKILCDAGLLERLSEGNWAFYRQASNGDGRATANRLLSLLPDDDQVIARDLERLAEVKAGRNLKADSYFQTVADEWDRIRALNIGDKEVEQAVKEVLCQAPLRRLIDIGTGTGRMLEIMAPHVEEATGIDRSHQMLTIARAKLDHSGLGNCGVRYADMYGLPFAAAAFDAAVIHQVLHFADDPGAVLAEAARVLVPGGRVVVVDFARHDLEELRDEFQHRRLGFDDAGMSGWFAAAGLGEEPPIRLAGAALTVVVWSAVKGTGKGNRRNG